MKRINIISSTIKSIGYDIKTRILEVEFVRGAIYQYKTVDYIDVVCLLFADSIGSYFNKNISKNYSYEEIK